MAAKSYDQLSDDDLIDLIGRGAILSTSTTTLPESMRSMGDRIATEAIKPPERTAGGPKSSKWKPREGLYQPLDSVWYGEEDAELVERLLAFYPRREPRRILDATVNGGRFWRGSARPVIGIDIDLRHRPDICADNNAMPFADQSFDVVVYDPPHIPNQGRDRVKDFNTRFGLGARSQKENGYSFSYTYPTFLVEAWRVLVDEGLLLCKIVDYIHNHRYQWAHIDLIQASREIGFTACDCLIKVRKGPIVDPKWKVAHHSRRQHCYWIVFRKSNRCE